MADQPSIFNSNEQQATQPNQQTPPGSNPGGAPNNATDVATLLSSIKNERGEQKYSTLEAALEGLRNAQEFIPNLRAQQAQKDAEIEELRKQAERVQALEESLAALTSQREQSQNTPAPALDENKLADLVNQTLTKREQQAVATANVQTVVSSLQQSFGADAEKKFYDKATELGMTMAEMNALAAKSPKAVLTMLGVSNQSAHKPNQPTPTSGTVNTAAFTPQENSFIGRNPTPSMVGATTADLRASTERAKKMVEELHAKGLSVHDLTNPKVYAQYFK